LLVSTESFQALAWIGGDIILFSWNWGFKIRSQWAHYTSART